MVDGEMLDPTVESWRLDPIVEGRNDESAEDDVSRFRGDSPIPGPARPVSPISNPVGPVAPISRPVFGLTPIRGPVSPSAPIAVPLVEVFPMSFPTEGLLPISAPVFAPEGNVWGRTPLLIASSLS